MPSMIEVTAIQARAKYLLDVLSFMPSVELFLEPRDEEVEHEPRCRDSVVKQGTTM